MLLAVVASLTLGGPLAPAAAQTRTVPAATPLETDDAAALEAAVGRTAGPAPALAGIPDEEVIVRGSRSLRRMQLAVRQARLDFFELYNTLNTNDRFDMSCKTEYVLGSRVKQEICMPVHARQAYSSSARMQTLGAGVYDPTADIVNSNREMAASMARLVNSSPELKDALQRYEVMLERFGEAVRAEFGE